jgi:hypothetical protein
MAGGLKRWFLNALLWHFQVGKNELEDLLIMWRYE